MFLKSLGSYENKKIFAAEKMPAQRLHVGTVSWQRFSGEPMRRQQLYFSRVKQALETRRRKVDYRYTMLRFFFVL